jgi:hypothetical protein
MRDEGRGTAVERPIEESHHSTPGVRQSSAALPTAPVATATKLAQSFRPPRQVTSATIIGLEQVRLIPHPFPRIAFSAPFTISRGILVRPLNSPPEAIHSPPSMTTHSPFT